MLRVASLIGLVSIVALSLMGDLQGLFPVDVEHPAIEYSTRPVTDPVSQLNLKIRQGSVHLNFNDAQGYLRSVLDALNVPIESQMVVFSKTSIQMARITPSNPRSLYFNDSVTVGWVRGGPIVELAAEDPKQGVIFYTLDEEATGQPQFVRRDACLSCHLSSQSLGVPGMMVGSVFTGPNGQALHRMGDYETDDRSPFEERWGGWYVTGITGSTNHMGNAFTSDPADPKSFLTNQTLNLESLKGKFDTNAYLAPYSDVVALMVFEHEMHMINLFTRVGWETRLALYKEQAAESRGNNHAATLQLLHDASRELVDNLLFIDEPELPSEIQGTSGFTEAFGKKGPNDTRGRSLRQFDLERRLMRYPCSFMIYSDAFDALPDEAKDATYLQLWQVLSGQDKVGQYAKLSFADRKAVVEILRETKKELPVYFQPVTH